MDSGVGAVRFPTVQIGLGFLQTLEAFSFERGSLRVPDAGFNFSSALDKYSYGVARKISPCQALATGATGKLTG